MACFADPSETFGPQTTEASSHPPRGQAQTVVAQVLPNKADKEQSHTQTNPRPGPTRKNYTNYTIGRRQRQLATRFVFNINESDAEFSCSWIVICSCDRPPNACFEDTNIHGEHHRCAGLCNLATSSGSVLWFNHVRHVFLKFEETTPEACT